MYSPGTVFGVGVTDSVFAISLLTASASAVIHTNRQNLPPKMSLLSF